MPESRAYSLKELGHLAKMKREAAGDTQEQAAAKLNISQPQVCRAEAGESRYQGTCIALVELYSDLEVFHPAFGVRPKPGAQEE